MRLTQWVKMMHRAHPKGNIPRAAILRGFFPRGVLQSHLPPHTSGSQQRNRSEGSVPPTRTQTHHRQVRDSHRAMGKLPQYPGQAQVTGIKCPSRGSGHKPQDQTEPLRGRHKDQEELGSCSLQGTDHKHRKCNKTRGQRAWCRGRGKIISYKNH